MADTYKLLQERILKINLGIASLSFLIPLILWIIEGQRYRSISAYAGSPHPWILPVLLTLSSTAFLIEGIAHRADWEQFIIGASLIGIALTPVHIFYVPHIIFTGLYFFGSSFVMIWKSTKKLKTRNIIFAILSSGVIIGAFAFHLFPVFYAEWLAFVPAIIVKWQRNMKFYKTIK